jgi:putative oxidoreductase
MRNSSESGQRAFVVLRIMLAILIGIHGWHRLYEGSVLGFARGMDEDLFLGFYLVLALQFFETVGSVAFAFGRFVFPLSLIYAVIYTAAIVFFHNDFGWFKMGGKQNGSEYAVALIICFLSVGMQNAPALFFKPLRFFRSSHATA